MARAPINGATLRWAREAMNVDSDELARAANVKEERVTEFESGNALPTLRQLEAMSKKLDRTLAFFFTEPPTESDIPTTADFRAHDGEPIPSLLAREMRRAEQYRDTVIDLEGLPATPAIIGHVTWNNVAARAHELRRVLGLDDAFTPTESRESQVLNFWRSLLERHGYLIFQTTRVGLNAFRGLSIHHRTLPIILLNGGDSNYGKVFTLFHEIAHLANRTSGMCSLDETVGEEALANAFAANFLMPRGRVEAIATRSAGAALERSEAVAEEFKVSVLAAAVRLRTLSLISDAELNDVRRESDQRWSEVQRLRKSQRGGPAAWRTPFRDLGSSYVGTIARALEAERVDLLDASYLLNARIPMVRQLLDEYYRVEGQ